MTADDWKRRSVYNTMQLTKRINHDPKKNVPWNLVRFHERDVGKAASWSEAPSIFDNDEFHEEQLFLAGNDEASSHHQWLMQSCVLMILQLIVYGALCLPIHRQWSSSMMRTMTKLLTTGGLASCLLCTSHWYRYKLLEFDCWWRWWVWWATSQANPSTLYKRDADLHVTDRAFLRSTKLQTWKSSTAIGAAYLNQRRLRSRPFQLNNSRRFYTFNKLIVNNVWPWKRWQGK